MKILAGVLAVLLLALPAWAREPVAAVGTIELAFTPWDDAEGAILRSLKQAHHAIYVQAYLLTSKTLAKALMDASQRGIAVAVLADHDAVMKNPDINRSQIPRLAAAGISVKLETRYAVAHNKIILIDPEDPHAAVITGSYNFTFSAQARNAENLLILRGNPALAAAYLANWRRHDAEAQPYSGVR